MSDIPHLKRQAARYLRLAETVSDEFIRIQMTKLAAEYEEMALDLELQSATAPAGSKQHH